MTFLLKLDISAKKHDISAENVTFLLKSRNPDPVGPCFAKTVFILRLKPLFYRFFTVSGHRSQPIRIKGKCRKWVKQQKFMKKW